MNRAILIADDDPPLLNLLHVVVGHEPRVDVVVCRDGDEAIAALKDRHFDVVLLDLMMPRRNGLDVIEFLRQQRPSQLHVVLVLTAASDELTRNLDPNVVHAVITKPFDIYVLRDLIRGLLAAADEMRQR